MRRAVLILLVGAAAAAAGLLRFFGGSSSGSPEYLLASVDRGFIASVVSSSGTLSPVTTVQVGSQVSGQIKELLVDYNTEVRKGQVVARIDPLNFEARVRQSEAELGVARANVAIQEAAVSRAQAELRKARAALTAARAQSQKAYAALKEAKANFERKKVLRARGIISESEYDDARTTLEQADAQWRVTRAQQKGQRSAVASQEAALRMTEAQVEHARAQVEQRQAALRQARIDLEHSVIRSPVDGVVIDRSVDIGQTVAASLQAPTLFTIARDLREMEVYASVDEADIGRVREGQRATFTVDAFAAETFTGEVRAIRKAPQTLQNVVTYTVVISADNADLRLLPGMTASVQIIVDERRAALRIPNAALRFTPPAAAAMPAGTRSGPGAAGGKPAAKPGRVWVLSDNQAPRAVQVLLGISDGNFTEVLDGDLQQGQAVIVGSRSAGQQDSRDGRRFWRF